MYSNKPEAFTEVELDNIVNRVTQLFRECKNAVTVFSQNLKALGSMTRQKDLLQSAFRRHQFLLGDPKNSSFSIPPLGVLNYFSPSVTEGLIAQHTIDQASLVAALFSTRKKWSENIQKMNLQLERVEGAMLSSIPAHHFSGSQNVAGHPPRLHPGQGASLLGHPDPVSPERVKTILLGLHGFASALTKMQSILQEVVLALRKDYQRISFDGCCPSHMADHLSFLLCSATEKYSGAQVFPLEVFSPEERVGRDSCFNEEGNKSEWAEEEEEEDSQEYGFSGGVLPVNPMGEQPAIKLFSFVEALEQMESFVLLRWKHCCSSLLNEQSIVILDS